MTLKPSNSAKKLTDTTGRAVESVVAASQEAMDNLMKSSSQTYEQGFANVKGRIDEAVKRYDELTTFGKDNVEAFVAAGNAAAKGVESLTSELLTLSKSNLEESLAAGKAIMGAKTLQEMFDLQTTFARSSFDKLMAQTTKMGELATKATKDTFEPLSGRVNLAVEKFAKVAA